MTDKEALTIFLHIVKFKEANERKGPIAKLKCGYHMLYVYFKCKGNIETMNKAANRAKQMLIFKYNQHAGDS